MKRTLLFTAIVSVLTTSAFATSSTVTSKDYVDNALETKQNQITSYDPGNDEFQSVLTDTVRTGVVGKRRIMDMATYNENWYWGDLVDPGFSQMIPDAGTVGSALAEIYDEIDISNLQTKIPAQGTKIESTDSTYAPSVVTNGTTAGSVGQMAILTGYRVENEDGNAGNEFSDYTNADSLIPTALAVRGELQFKQDIIPATEWHDVYDTPIPGVVISTNTDGEVEQRMILDKTQNIRDESIDRLVSLGYDDGRQDNSVFDDIHDNSVSSTDINYAVPTTTMTVAIANAAANTKQAKKTCAGWLDGTTVADATHTDANCVLWNLPD